LRSGISRAIEFRLNIPEPLPKERTMKLESIDLTPRVGTEIQADVETLLSGSASAEVRHILEQRGVICFREIHLDDQGQVAFAMTMGSIVQHDGRGIFKITLDNKENPLSAAYIKGSFFWHIDDTLDDTPNFAVFLSARKLSPIGGQTEFANTYAAYEGLPESEKIYLDTLKVVHTLETSQSVVNPTPTKAQREVWQRRPAKTHPLVWRHRTGRKSLVLGTSASHVEGMSMPDGRALLCRLTQWTTQPEYVYQHQWKVGDLVIWDNTGTMHRATPYAADSGRLMHRTTLIGEEALA
jgi:alpha-ketoglutarate-dependent taurine dioxygenase